MSIFNKWLSPLERSFGSIKSKLLDSLDNIKDPNDPSKPLITDKSEGNILVLLISHFSAIAEVLHFYVDNFARETFLPTARRYSSLLKHAKLVDYAPQGATASRVNIAVTRDTDSSNLINYTTSNILLDNDGNTWLPDKDGSIPEGSTYKIVSFTQHRSVETTLNYDQWIGDKYLLVEGIPSDELYEEGSMALTIDGNSYSSVRTFAHSKPTDYHCRVIVIQEGDNSKQIVLIEFGDNVNGYKPTINSSTVISAKYYVTRGELGNISSNYFNQTWLGLRVNNSLPSGGGSDYEDFETLKRRIQNSVKTLDVAITKEDFKDLAMTRPGIGQAAIEYECGRKLNVYISSLNGNPPSEGQCEDVRTYLLQHCPLTTWLDVKPVGITYIILDITVTGRKSYKKAYIRSQIEEALANKYSAANAEIGGSVRLSDIYALIDNLSSVDYLRVNKFYLKPWPKTLRGTQLVIEDYNLIQCDRNMEYVLEFGENNNIGVYSKYNGYIATRPYNSSEEGLVVNDTINGVNFSMKFSENFSATPGYKYSIYITQNNLDYEEPGYNLPIINISDNSKDLILNINEVL